MVSCSSLLFLERLFALRVDDDYDYDDDEIPATSLVASLETCKRLDDRTNN